MLFGLVVFGFMSFGFMSPLGIYEYDVRDTSLGLISFGFMYIFLSLGSVSSGPIVTTADKKKRHPGAKSSLPVILNWCIFVAVIFRDYVLAWNWIPVRIKMLFTEGILSLTGSFFHWFCA